MLKNAVIALLISTLVMQIEEYAELTGPVMFICMVAVLFYALAAVEDAIDRYKDRRYRQRKLQKQIAEACTHGSGVNK